MLLTESPPTPLDLRFRLFGVDVRVHPLFWLISVLLGWSLTHRPIQGGNGMIDVAVWVLASFGSILLHEFGHVWMWQVFGVRSHILLHSMGGLAIPEGGDVPRRWQHILVSAAGPGIQILLFLALLGLMVGGVLTPPPRTRAEWTYWDLLLDSLLFINLYWALVNLLPIWPLDGGQITREVCAIVSPRTGALAAYWISLVVSAALAINALLGHNGQAFIPYAPTGTYTAILFALFAAGSWQMIQLEQQNRYSSPGIDDRPPWER